MNPGGDNLKTAITQEICDFVKNYMEKPGISTRWRQPLVGFAHESHPYIQKLKAIIGPSHEMPKDVLPDAGIIVAYFVPFTKELSRINAKAGRHAAPEWAVAYEETNTMFGFINEHLIGYLNKIGYKGKVSEETKTFDQNLLKSNWSHRHFAYAAGLGTFGVNNMLITKSGCSGRYFTLVTNLDVTPDEPMKEELCLYKSKGKCLACVRNCPANALSDNGYQRQACFELIKENAAIHTGYGSSYSYSEDIDNQPGGSQVCGKCITASPCGFMGRESE